MASVRPTASPSATAIATAIGRRAPERWSCASPSCARAVTSRAFSSRAGWRRRPSPRSCRRPMSRASRPARSTSLVRAMGMDGISKSQVSRLCEEIDEKVKPFLGRPIEGEWPYVWLDATYLKVRRGGRIVSVAVVIAIGVNGDGRREVLGLDICPSEAETFWSEFLRKLARRGLRGVKLVISDAHEGLKSRRRQGARRLLAALPRPLHAQRARARQQERPPRRLGLHRHRFRARLGRRRRQAMAAGRRPVARQTAKARRPARRSRGRRPRVHELPQGALGQDQLDQSHRARSTARSSAAPMSSASSPTTTPSSGSSAPS